MSALWNLYCFRVNIDILIYGLESEEEKKIAKNNANLSYHFCSLDSLFLFPS